MIQQAIAFVLETIFNLFILVALVRFWMQVFRVPARNPMTQFTIAVTDFAVRPLRRIIPGLFGLDLASLVVAWMAEFLLQALLLMLVSADLPANPAIYSVLLFVALVKLVRLTVYIVMGAVLLQALLSWVNPHHPVAPFFDAITKPFLKPFQRAIPPIGGVDVTPVVVLILCQLVLMLPVGWLELQGVRLIARFAL
jgi:YggT family protein